MYYSFILIIVPLFQIAHAQIRILQPQSLVLQFPHGSIRGSTAAFGTPYWGETLIGRLEYNDTKGNNYCNADDYDLPKFEDITEQINVNDDDIENSRHWPRIVVVRRGGCHFAKKVKVAQDSKHASAVIIVDEIGSTRTPSEIRTIIMADDGLGSKIRIPSVLISNGEGSKLIEALKTGQSVVTEMMWDVPNENIVGVDHWISPGISTSLNFLASFAPYARALKYRMNFKPHFFLFSLPADANSMCLETNAKFCSIAPDWPDANTTGLQVVQEILRESCLWYTTKSINVEIPESGEYSEAWWSYMEKVGDRCLRPSISSTFHQQPFSKECSHLLMKELDIDPIRVELCINTVGTSQLTTDLYNHAWSPVAMMINDARFAGPLDAFVVARAICTGFTLNNEPVECEALKTRHIHDVLFNHQTAPYIFGESYGYHKGGVAWWVYFLSAVVILLLCGSIILLYRLWLIKQLKNELRYEVFEEVKSQLGARIQTQHKESLSIPSLNSDYATTNHPTSYSAVEFPNNRYTTDP